MVWTCEVSWATYLCPNSALSSCFVILPSNIAETISTQNRWINLVLFNDSFQLCVLRNIDIVWSEAVMNYRNVCLEGLSSTTINVIQDTSLRAEIWTRGHPNTKQDCWATSLGSFSRWKLRVYIARVFSCVTRFICGEDSCIFPLSDVRYAAGEVLRLYSLPVSLSERTKFATYCTCFTYSLALLVLICDCLWF
jgi:hypothetical protein